MTDHAPGPGVDTPQDLERVRSPVSYTHLDVYKRQLIACSVLALALVIERFVSLKTAKVAPPKLLDEVLAVTRSAVPLSLIHI